MKQKLDTLKKGGADLVALLREKRIAEELIKRDPYTSDLAKREKLAAAKQAARAKYDRLAERLQQTETELRADVAATFAPPADPQAALLAMKEEERAWRRAKPLLDMSPTLLTAVDKIVMAQVDGAMVRCLRTELPAYVLARDFPEGLEGAQATLRRLEEPYLTPAQKEARAIEAELDRGWPRLRTGIAHAGAVLDGLWGYETPIVGFDGGIEQV